MALLFSDYYYFSARAYQDPLRLVKRQLLFLAIGAGVAFIASLPPLDLVRRAMPFLLLATFVFVLLPFVPAEERLQFEDTLDLGGAVRLLGHGPTPFPGQCSCVPPL